MNYRKMVLTLLINILGLRYSDRRGSRVFFIVANEDARYRGPEVTTIGLRVRTNKGLGIESMVNNEIATGKKRY